MRFTADLHIHSKYSRACSKDCDLEHLALWARRKGITLVGTGDFTHPAWSEHLSENLLPAEPGLFRLRDEPDLLRTLPPALAQNPVRFLLTVEISTIYKRGERTRKVHHVVHVPSLSVAQKFTTSLARIGNLGADGRPILGLDSRDLLEIVLESGDGAFLVPAHIWTPWFAVLGSKSGFDSIADCYADLADHIFAVETGLSSDPAMNWRVSSLDRYRLVSNSDAHSPPMLGREATVFDTDLSYDGVLQALRGGNGLVETLEFFPEEGKYHADGHRACEINWDPEQTLAHEGLCTVCGKPVTVGVLNRVEQLADRPVGSRPASAAGFRSLIPLPEVVSEIVGTGPRSKRVGSRIDELTASLGSELDILSQAPTDVIASCPSPIASVLAEAVGRLRRGEVLRQAGYDGEYGVIRLFEPGELARRATVSVPTLFDDVGVPGTGSVPRKETGRVQQPDAEGSEQEDARTVRPHQGPGTPQQGADLAGTPGAGSIAGLDPDQSAAARIPQGPVLIVAGPGTGKTRTLTHRIAHLVTRCAVEPQECLAITFTRRAAQEMTERLTELLADRARDLTIATFHSLGLRILREQHARVGLGPEFSIADPAQQFELAVAAAGSPADARRLLAARSRGEASHEDSAERYLKELRERDLVDLDDLIALPVALLEPDPALAAEYRQRYRWVCVDEYQDVDELQYTLLRLLVPSHGNLTAIGDPDQSIYRFRGSDVSFFLRFHEDFPAARTVHLTRNYRTSAPIITSALSVVAPGSLVPDRVLEPVAPLPAVRVGLHTAVDARAEASFVARSIEQTLGGTSFHSLDSGRVKTDGLQGLGFNDIAVLYRTDRQAAALMEALTVAGLPFQKRGHDRLGDRPGVAQILAELRPDDGEPVLALVRAAADRAHRQSPDTAVHTAVDLLTPLAGACGTDLEHFRTQLTLGVDVDTWDRRADQISLLTLHASKGLEFDLVYIVGCEDGLLPLSLPGRQPDPQEIDEERRLLFVGMTRARRRLVLTHARERTTYGSTQRRALSPFLSVLDPQSYDRIGPAAPRHAPRQSQLRLV